MNTKLIGMLGLLTAFFATTSMTAVNASSTPSNVKTIVFDATKDTSDNNVITKDGIMLRLGCEDRAFDAPNGYYTVAHSQSNFDFGIIDSAGVDFIKAEITFVDDSTGTYGPNKFDPEGALYCKYSYTGKVGTAVPLSTEETGIPAKICGLTLEIETRITKVTIYVPERFSVTEAIGGHHKNIKGKDIQLCAFGFQLASYTDVMEFGVSVYSESTCTSDPIYEIIVSDDEHLQSLTANKGRFYLVFDRDVYNNFADNTTYYAVGTYTNNNGNKFTSSIVSAKGNDRIEYK